MPAYEAIFEAPATHEAGTSWGEAGWGETGWGEASWGEADQFFGKFKLKNLGALAKSLAPMAAKTLAGMVPGGSLVSGALGSLMREVDGEVSAFESVLFSHGGSAEVASEMAREALLAEVLAGEAAQARTAAGAATLLAGSLPITITVMGGRQVLRPVTPVLAQATSRLVGVLGAQGPAGRQLIRAVPAMHRRTVKVLTAAAGNGQPVSSSLAVRAMARAASGVLSNPTAVQTAVRRNIALGSRGAGPTRCRCGRPVAVG